MHLNVTSGVIGVAVLATGAAVYVLDRAPELSLVGSTISFFHLKVTAFGAIGQNLPSFAHVFAFVLFTAALLDGKRLTNLGVCLGWLAVDVGFELGQHPQFAESIAKTIPAWFAHIPILDRTTMYFLGGTFDPLDLLFAALGALTAYVVIEGTYAQRVRHEV